MGDFFSSLNLKQDFTRKVLYDVAKFVFILIALSGGSFLIAKILAVNVTAFQPYYWSVAILLLGIFGLISLLLYRRFSRFRPRFPRLEFDFVIVGEELVYEYQNANQFTYRKKKTLRALRGGLDVYNDRYHWTGRGSVNVRSAIPEQQFRETVRKNVWQFYEIRFPRTLNKGDVIETDIIWELEDTSGQAVPFMSATIEEPTDRIKLLVSLAPDLGVSHATREISVGLGMKRPLSSETMTINREGKGSWEIKKPPLLYHYEIRWIMPDRANP